MHALRVSMSWSVTVNGSDVGERGGLLGLWRTRSRTLATLPPISGDDQRLRLFTRSPCGCQCGSEHGDAYFVRHVSTPAEDIGLHKFTDFGDRVGDSLRHAQTGKLKCNDVRHLWIAHYRP